MATHNLDTGGRDPAFFYGGPEVHQLDAHALAVLAYTVAAGVVERHASGDPNAMDVPIGAVAYDLTTGKPYTGFPRDRELDDRKQHAEPRAVTAAKDDGAEPGNLQVVTTFEPCPDCLEGMADDGVQSVSFVTDRDTLAWQGLVKHHAQSAIDIAAGSRDGRPYPPLRQLTDPTLQVACLALFDPFERDPVSEEVAFRPNGGGIALPSFADTVAVATNGNLAPALAGAHLYLSQMFATPKAQATA